ncbi:hypothetical protein C8Q78DRAFT_318671 [Trametes maxima]|nr:hypothetical protein C8Q78DRAFT_318671 [Trametes maxima]
MAPTLPASDAPHPDLQLADSFGAMLVSTIIAATLYGVTVLQSLYYYEKFPEDSWMMKVTVAILWILDTITIILDTHAVFHFLVTNFNNPSALLDQVWSMKAEIPFTFTAVFIVQIFFVVRIYQLRPYAWYIPAAIGTIAVAGYGLLIGIVVEVSKMDSLAGEQSAKVNNPLIANWALGLVVDVAITVVLCWYLWSEKVYVRHKTHRVINRIIIFSVNRGAIAATAQLMSFLTRFIWPHNLVWLAFHNMLSKVYTNSMLATLNSRTAFRNMMSSNDFDGTDISMPTIRGAAYNGRPGRESARPVVRFCFAPVLYRR